MTDLKDRTREFALRIIRLSASLPTNRFGDVMGRQVLRSGTSVGAHFRESLRARSKAEYVAKLNGGLMELEETLYWLEIIEGAKLVPPAKLEPLQHEAGELTAIFVSLIKKWRGK
ncbi:MAG: four helix bundle protein [Thermoanaerobaculia bacterium]|jgi:four helix bundle protein